MNSISEKELMRCLALGYLPGMKGPVSGYSVTITTGLRSYEIEFANGFTKVIRFGLNARCPNPLADV